MTPMTYPGRWSRKVLGMDETARRSLIGVTASILIGAGVAIAVSDGGVTVGSFPVFALCALLAYGINWIVFIPSNAAKTEKYFDLTGSITYITVTIVAVLLSGDADARVLIVAAMVIVWALRLGTFLFRRIRKDGRDGRFDEIKVNPLRFFAVWTIQGLWVLVTATAAWAIITTSTREELGWVGYLGIAVWLLGFGIEVIADRQKAAFRADPANKGRFITSGLWAWSRHPNYFGEITLWAGIAIMAIPVLSGWQWVALISPIWVIIQLTRVSGLPMLERRSDERWGDEPAYQEYKKTTPVLVPRPPRS